VNARVELGAREQLLAALVARAAAAEAVIAARAASDRAGELLANAEMRAYQFSLLGVQIEADTAARIATWASSGGEQPSLSPDPRFADQIRRRTEADQHADAARSAVENLGSALAEAARRFASAENAVQAGATACMIEMAKPLGDRLKAARAEVWALEVSLSALGGMWVPNEGGVPRPLPLPPSLNEAILNREPPWRAPGVRSPANEAWSALRAKLVGGDVEANLGEADRA
jgi:hypothetical protein